MIRLRGRLKKWNPFVCHINWRNGGLAIEGVASGKAALALRFKSLHGNMDGLDLSGINFRLCEGLRGVQARKSRFDNAVFGLQKEFWMQDEREFTNTKVAPPVKGKDSANIDAMDVSFSSFRNAVLTKVLARNADFSGCDMTNADLRDGDFAGARFEGADFTGVRVDSRTIFSAGALDGVRNLDRAIVVDYAGREIATARLTSKGILYPLRGAAPAPVPGIGKRM